MSATSTNEYYTCKHCTTGTGRHLAKTLDKDDRGVQLSNLAGMFNDEDIDDGKDMRGFLIRGGPTLRTFFSSMRLFTSLMRGGRINKPVLAGHHRSAIETPFKWCFTGVPMMAHH